MVDLTHEIPYYFLSDIGFCFMFSMLINYVLYQKIVVNFEYFVFVHYNVVHLMFKIIYLLCSNFKGTVLMANRWSDLTFACKRQGYQCALKIAESFNFILDISSPI